MLNNVFICSDFSIFVPALIEVYNLNLAIIVKEVQNAHIFFVIGVLNLIEGSLLRVNYLLIVFDIIAFHELLLYFVDFIVVEIRKQVAVLLVSTMPKNTSRLEHLNLPLDLLFFNATHLTVV